MRPLVLFRADAGRVWFVCGSLKSDTITEITEESVTTSAELHKMDMYISRHDI